MKDKDEKHIQQLAEHLQNGVKESDRSLDYSEDVSVYQRLFLELSNQTPVANHFTLAEKVVMQINRKQQKAESVRYAALMLAIAIFFVFITGLSIMFVGPGTFETIFNTVANHYPVFLFVALSLAVIRVLDKIFGNEDAQSLRV